jgi:hypothetical protein
MSFPFHSNPPKTVDLVMIPRVGTLAVSPGGTVVDAHGELWLSSETRAKGTLLATDAVTKRRDLAGAGMKRLGITPGKASLFVVIGGVLACAFVWEFQRPLFEGNLAIVDPGRVIRSAQPTSQLAQWISDFHLKSILNLRGGSPADRWYEAEVRAARENGLSFYDLPLSATRRPGRTELLRLIDILQRCPYPLLIHC